MTGKLDSDPNEREVITHLNKPPMTSRTDLPSAFVTYGWCRSSYAVVWSLGRRGVPVHVGDASPLAMSRFSRYCRSFTRLPDFFREPEAYVERVCHAVAATGAKVLLPAHEDVELFCRHRNQLPADLAVALPRYDACVDAGDKLVFLERARAAGCPVPQTTIITTLDQLDRLEREHPFPLVVKARTGNSAKGVRIVRTAQQLRQCFSELVERYHLPNSRWPIIQEFLPGPKYGALAVFDRGQYVAGFAVRYLRCKESGDFGTSSYRISAAAPDILQHTAHALAAFDWHGVVDLDFIEDQHGVARLIEINPRLGGTIALAQFSGVDLPYLWYLIALGQPLPQSPPPRAGVKARWLVGDGLALVDRIKRRRFREALDILRPQKNCCHDDFHPSDPCPLFFEATDYLSKFLKARGSLNPATEGMIR